MRGVQKPPGRPNAPVHQGRKTFGDIILQPFGDESVDASAQEFLLHLPGMFRIMLSQDGGDVVGQDGLAEARMQRTGFVRRCCNCFFDVHYWRSSSN
jgi:hypothetical protein